MRGRVAEVHHDVRVDMRDLRVADSSPFESALNDQATCPDAFDLLEHRSGARMPVQPRMLATELAQILLHVAVQRHGVLLHETHSRGSKHVLTMMKHRVV